MYVCLFLSIDDFIWRAGLHVTGHRWRSEDNFSEVVFSCHLAFESVSLLFLLLYCVCKLSPTPAPSRSHLVFRPLASQICSTASGFIHGFQRSDSGCQAWGQALLPAELPLSIDMDVDVDNLPSVSRVLGLSQHWKLIISFCWIWVNEQDKATNSQPPRTRVGNRVRFWDWKPLHPGHGHQQLLFF